MQTILFAVKGWPEHTMDGFVTASDKGFRYILHGMKKHTLDIVKDFEAFVSADIGGEFHIQCF